MFVKIREYQLAKGGKSLRLEIVENYRDKCSGNVRQRNLAYLGTVKEDWIKYPRVRDEFWRRTEDKLSSLDLSPDDQRKIRATIEKLIPRGGTTVPTLSTVTKQEPTVNELLRQLLGELGA